MPGFPMPDSGGAPAPEHTLGGQPRPGGFLPSGKPGGQITISRREALALIAFDSEDDDNTAISRARRETNFDDDQLRRLKDRAEKVRSKGYTLMNGTHKFMPTNYDGDQDSLLGMEEQKGDFKNRGMRDGRRAAGAARKEMASDAVGRSKQPKPSAGATKRMQEAWARVHECDGNEMCGPCRAAHEAAEPARRAFRRRMQEKKRKTSCMSESARRPTEADRFEKALREAQGPVAFGVLTEKWSDAARAAAAAARKAKAGGKNWRTAARRTYSHAANRAAQRLEDTADYTRDAAADAMSKVGNQRRGRNGLLRYTEPTYNVPKDQFRTYSTGYGKDMGGFNAGYGSTRATPGRLAFAKDQLQQSRTARGQAERFRAAARRPRGKARFASR